MLSRHRRPSAHARGRSAESRSRRWLHHPIDLHECAPRHHLWMLGSFGHGKHRRIAGIRSEEHTSELQSLMRISYAVFCLKKKKLDTSMPQTSYTSSTRRTE